MFMNSQNADNLTAFQNFKSKHGKIYASKAEETLRFAIYIENIDKINKHNAKIDKTFTMAENHFSDLTLEEFKSMYLKLKS